MGDEISIFPRSLDRIENNFKLQRDRDAHQSRLRGGIIGDRPENAKSMFDQESGNISLGHGEIPNKCSGSRSGVSSGGRDQGNPQHLSGVQAGMMWHRLIVAGVVALSAYAQAPPSFEVASVKANNSEARGGTPPQFVSGGRFVSTNIPLLFVVAAAWNLPFQGPRLTGDPNVLSLLRDRYDIEAKAPAGTFPAGMPERVRLEKMRLMVQVLLADRFKLVMRKETKELPIYAVVAAKGGPKLEKAKTDEAGCLGEGVKDFGVLCHSFNGGQGRGLHGAAVDVSDLALYVENWAQRPVVDKTGIKGLFHIETKPWQPITLGPVPAEGAKAEDGSEAADLPTLFTVFEALGLKLESQKERVDIFRIERVERPSQN